MQNIYSPATLQRLRQVLRRRTLRQRVLKTVYAVVALATIANAGSLYRLIGTQAAHAATTGGTVTIHKQIDKNGDGTADTVGAEYLAEWGFTIDPIGDEATTDTTGTATLTVTPDGTYSVSETTYYTGYQLETASCVISGTDTPVGTYDSANYAVNDISLTGGASVDCTFLNTVDTSSINGQVFNDVNGNGIWDEGSPSQMTDWSIFLDVNKNGTYDAGTDQMTTIESNPSAIDYGWYHFFDLPDGTYQVCEVQKDHWTPTFPTTVTGCHTITVFESQAGDTCTLAAPTDPYDMVCDFGNQQQASITVLKNVDTDGNGTVDVTGATDWTWNVNAGAQHYATGSTQYVTPGAVTLTEDQQAGYHLTGATCAVNQDPFTVDLSNIAFTAASGASYVCTLTNTKMVTTLGLTKSANVTNAQRSTSVTYTMNWSVDGNSQATGVRLTDPVPTNITFGSAANGGTYDAATKTITWDLGTQAPGAHGQVTWTGTVSATAPAGNIVNTASIDSNETDPAVTASATITVVVPQVLGDTAAPKLEVTKSVNLSTVYPGQTVTYTIVVKNVGNGTAGHVMVTDTLPTDFVFADDQMSTRSWTYTSLAAGESKTMTADVVISQSALGGTYTNTVTAKADDLAAVQATANVLVKLKAPVVLGLATTGVGTRDYSIFGLGIIIMGLGLVNLNRLRRRASASRA